MEARRREHEHREEREMREEQEPRERLEPVHRAEYVYEPRMAEHRDVVHWGPVWAGLITAFGVLIVLGLLALAVGLATAPTAPGAPGGPGVGTAIVSIIGVLIAFFAGGWVTGRTSSIRDRFSSVVQGTAVWGLGLVLLTLMTAIGISGLLSVFANYIVTLGGGAVAPGEAAGPAFTTFVGVVLTWAATIAGAIVGAGATAPEIEGY